MKHCAGHTYFGDISHPCCIKAPSEYQRLFEIVKSLLMFFSSTFHSDGLNRLTKNRTTLTPTYANKMHIQISEDNGSMKENMWAPSSAGFLIMMLMPKLM